MVFEVGEAVEVTTEDVAQGGWCVARSPGLPVLFVRHALPGERVVARVTEVTSRFARADAVEIREPSPDRVAAPCPYAHSGGCGGCDWQHASLAAQRALKAAVIAQQLRRLAGIDREVTVEPLPGDSPDTAEPGAAPGLGWRTRVQFAVGPDGVAGLRGHRSHEVIDIGDCPIAHPAIRDLGLAAWELPTQFDEPWRSGDVLRLALRAAGMATAAAARDPRLAINDIAGQVRSLAIDIVRASEAAETDHSALTDAPTEELLAALPLPEPATA